MTAAAIVYFLFAIVAGAADGASMITLSSYTDAATCNAAASAVNTAMKDGAPAAEVFCISSTDVGAFTKAAQAPK